MQAWKKIKETKKKAEEIMHVRMRNQQTREEKNQIAAQRDWEKNERAAQNMRIREKQKQNINYNKATH